MAFDAGLGVAFRERVPFRLTRDIVDGMGPTGVEGVFRYGGCKRQKKKKKKKTARGAGGGGGRAHADGGVLLVLLTFGAQTDVRGGAASAAR